MAQWSGPRSLPLWLTEPEVLGISSLSNARARAAGLDLRPLRDTLADTLAWTKANNIATVTSAGLSDEDERAILSQLKQH